MTLFPIKRGKQIDVPLAAENFFPRSSMFAQDKSETKSTSETMGLVELVVVFTTVLWLLTSERVSNYLIYWHGSLQGIFKIF